ncbi:MAG: glycosyltransferase family 9 protein [Candidatus Omnitrophica bacterium]|nr:glycosyltransferase family 9 protein [Candidatus Omnitrophota bacterium]
MKKILAFRNDRFGEFLLNIPAFRAIKETYPQAELHVVVAPQVEELARVVPFIDKVVVWPPVPRPIFNEIALIRKLQAEKYDAAVVLNPLRHSHHFIFWAGIPNRYGYSCKHCFMLNHQMPEGRNRLIRHEVENNLDLVALMGARTQDKSLMLNIDEAMRAAVRSKFRLDFSKGIVAVHPWTSDAVKQWPLENFEKLIAALARNFEGRILILGRPERWHREINLSEHPYVIDLKGQTTLLEAAAILSQCRCLISGDSGPMHLACAVQTPVVALFRNDIPGKTPDRWGPWGERHVVLQRFRLEDIAVREVLESAQQFFEK